MKNTCLQITAIFLILLFGCKSPNGEESSHSDKLSYANTNNQLGKPAIIEGKILNKDVCPKIKELKLIIPDFEGNQSVYLSKIDELGKFKFTIYPLTKREINLSPIEGVIIIGPGDSLYIIKDFKDIGNVSYSGTCAKLNSQISKFRSSYLGRYPSEGYLQPCKAFKQSCEKEKEKYYERLIKFQQDSSASDEFNNWATKQIEFDYCKVLFDYPMQHYFRTKERIETTDDYYSFIKDFERNMDNSIVMADYFELSGQFVRYLYEGFQKKYKKEFERKDTITNLLIEDVFSSSKNNYLAQLSLSSFINHGLLEHNTDRIDNNLEQIQNKINDPFLRTSINEHYKKVMDYNKNPNKMSDVLLDNTKNDLELNQGVSLNKSKEKNLVAEIIKSNPNKVLYVDFWATWCSPCVYYMGFSKKLKENFSSKDFEIVYICINSDKQNWMDKTNELKLEGTNIFCDELESRAVKKNFGFTAIPYYLLINKKGVIVDYGFHLNPQSNNLKQEILGLINE